MPTGKCLHREKFQFPQVLNLITDEYFLGDHPASLKDMCLNLMVIICTSVDNVSRNTLMEYLMMNSIFESLIHLLSNSGNYYIWIHRNSNDRQWKKTGLMSNYWILHVLFIYFRIESKTWSKCNPCLDSFSTVSKVWI